MGCRKFFESRGKLKQTTNRTKSQQWKTLLKSLELKGWMKTIDAIGCQKKIAEQIKEQEADYLLS